MKIIMIGGGELGQMLAKILCTPQNDLVVVDVDGSQLKRIKEHLDVMTVLGNGASIETLKQAGIETADILLAVGSDDTGNILACRTAYHFGVKTKICRLSRPDYFSEEDGLPASKLGIDYIVIPEYECVSKIIHVLGNRIVLEKISFSSPNASMVALEVTTESPLAGVRISEFPDMEMLSSVRFAAILRERELVIPTGETVMEVGDRVYIAGPKERVDVFIDWASPDDHTMHRIVIAGATGIGRELAYRLAEAGFSVRLIEEDIRKGELFLDRHQGTGNLMVINGTPSRKEVMIEAGIEECDAFISALDNDEENILNCILAKRNGARKVVTVTRRAEYEDIIPAMDMIDCGFCSSLVCVNTVLRGLGTGTGLLNIDAVLHRTGAFVYEFQVEEKSKLCHKKISEIRLPVVAVISLVFRGGLVLPASGTLELLPGDVVVTVATTATADELQPLFNKPGLFGAKL